jgi:hypothetical protein
MSPLYILILFHTLPPILIFALKDYAQKYKYPVLINATEDKPFLLNNLKRKYKYSKIKYITNSISYFITIILISLWQYNNNVTENINTSFVYVPVLILATGLALRLIAIIVYQIKLPYDLSHNKV